MKRFLITSPKFSGQAEVIYSDEGLLSRLDCQDTNMPPPLIAHFKSTVPVFLQDLAKSFSASTIIVEAEYEITFDMFWKKYNKKINKSRCTLLWGKMNKALQVQAYFGIDGYDKYLLKEGWRSKADPETYLRNKYWENEYR